MKSPSSQNSPQKKVVEFKADPKLAQSIEALKKALNDTTIALNKRVDKFEASLKVYSV